MPLADVAVTPRLVIPARELSVEFVRSSGPGGQHVNKTSTQAQLRWNVWASAALQNDQKTRVAEKLQSRLTASGDLILTCDQNRSRERNLEAVCTRLGRLVAESLQRPKSRRPTRPTRGSQRRRLEAKKQRSETKRLRRPPQD